MPDIRIPSGFLTVGGDYKPGDMPPSGYVDWHEWAEIQHKAGLRQIECGRCGKWRYPQELSSITDTFEAKDRRGRPVSVSTAVCKGCAQQSGEQ